MEELSVLKKRRKQLEYTAIILLIICGSILDMVDCIINLDYATWEILHDLCRELRLFGFAIFAYKHISFESIKLKSLSFMFIIWSSVIIVHNNLFSMHYTPILFTLYFVYISWLVRIITMKRKQEREREMARRWSQVNIYDKHKIPYNILLPVNSFRGLLQILFIPWKNPLYETRLLVDQNKTIGVVNNKFTAMEYSPEHVKNIVRKDCKIVVCKNYKKEKIYSLIGKRAILGIRDCKRLEV